MADVYTTTEENDGIARYNGNDTVSLSITKQQSETAVSVSNAVKKTIANLEGADENLHIITVRDDADSIISLSLIHILVQFTGSFTVNLDPRSGWLVTSMVPSQSLRIFFTNVSPRPLPSMLRLPSAW